MAFFSEQYHRTTLQIITMVLHAYYNSVSEDNSDYEYCVL